MHTILSHHCALCGTGTLKQLLCADCDADLLHYRAPACPICALPTSDGQVCGVCLKHPPAFDRTLAAFSYHFPVDRLLHAFKYSGNLALTEILAKPLALLAANHPKSDFLMPMPRHPGRLKERGFNQSLEIVKPISR